MSPLESQFQADVVTYIGDRYPSAHIIVNDGWLQGFPDLLILYKDKWAALECKRSHKASERPNQRYYIQNIQDNGGFARFIYPENHMDVFSELENLFDPQ